MASGPRARSAARRLNTAALACLALAVALAARGEPLPDVAEAYRLRGARQTPFDPRAFPGIASAESRFFERLFAHADEAVVLNVGVVAWLASDGRAGLHAAAYAERAEALHLRLGALGAPPRVAAVRDLLAGALRQQAAFFAEWAAARAAGEAFRSPLTDEYAWHEGLGESHRALLRAYAELRGLFPGADDAALRMLQDPLRAVDLR